MDKLTQYQTCIQTLLERHSNFKTSNADIETQLFFDTTRHHYQLMRVGWNDLHRGSRYVRRFGGRTNSLTSCWSRC